MTPYTSPHPEFATPSELASIIRRSRATVRRLEVRDPYFPKPYRNGRTVIFHVPTILAYLLAPGRRPASAAVDHPRADHAVVPAVELPEFLRPRTRKDDA